MNVLFLSLSLLFLINISVKADILADEKLTLYCNNDNDFSLVISPVESANYVKVELRYDWTTIRKKVVPYQIIRKNGEIIYRIDLGNTQAIKLFFKSESHWTGKAFVENFSNYNIGKLTCETKD